MNNKNLNIDKTFIFVNYSKVFVKDCLKISEDFDQNDTKKKIKDLVYWEIQNISNKIQYEVSEDVSKSIDIEKITNWAHEKKREYSDNCIKTKKYAKELIFEDFLVMLTLNYFKNDFFKWIDRPKCLECNEDNPNTIYLGMHRYLKPDNVNNISAVELYQCGGCGAEIEFPRIRNPIKLLETRMGRCGEWVDCFVYILRYILKSVSRVRYVWNKEDHVWCEYFSLSQEKWIHLDPCENAYDQNFIYCDNWKKKMSLCIAFGNDYIIDVSKKYIRDYCDKFKASSEVSKFAKIDKYIYLINCHKLAKIFITKYRNLSLDENMIYLLFFNDILKKQIMEKDLLTKNTHFPDIKDLNHDNNLKSGRQSGNDEWVTKRGECGT